MWVGFITEHLSFGMDIDDILMLLQSLVSVCNALVDQLHRCKELLHVKFFFRMLVTKPIVMIIEVFNLKYCSWKQANFGKLLGSHW